MTQRMCQIMRPTPRFTPAVFARVHLLWRASMRLMPAGMMKPASLAAAHAA